MSKITELLNAIAKALNTTDRNLCIIAAMQMLVTEGGLTVEAAFETVFGEGSWINFCGNVYEALRAEGSK